ncbi:heterokaryon incompatibility protein-domain-containing protein [Cadophora sp. MPI-SDFR-AT-0126]|nr:heterokaryon incompatibility protein-domain-containing protein [Leotiomycetes sp. MPI-SDFR-AT-0126]
MESSNIYQPLDPTQHEIRLIKVLPRNFFSHRPDNIFCTMKTTSLMAAAGKYEALSYAWGNEVSRDPIYLWVNGSEFTVTIQENLYQALVHLRDAHQEQSGGPFVLWVAALCINQNDEIEKTHQVKHMKSVYEKAEAVCVWLGVAADGSDRLIQRMERVCHRAIELEEAVAGSWIDVMPEIVTSTDEAATCPLTELIAFVSRPWWSRIWAVQEVAAATTVYFYCGHRCLTDMLMFCSIACFLSMRDTCSTKPHSVRSDYECRAALIQDFICGCQLSLNSHSWYMTDPSRSTVMEATDSRDFVFSLWAYAATRRNFDYNQITQNLNGPWHITLTVSDLFTDLGNLDLRPYMASHGMKQTLQVTRYSDRTPSLAVSTTALDRVRKVIGSTPSTSAYADIFQFWHSIFAAAQSKSSTEKQYENLSDAVFRLLTLDRERIDSKGLWTICKGCDSFFSNASRAYKLWVDENSRGNSEAVLERLKEDDRLGLFSVTSSTLTAGMQAFVTEKGWIGMGPGTLMSGDIVTIIAGLDVPFILRVDDQGKHRLVGDAYMYKGSWMRKRLIWDCLSFDIDLY